MKIKLIFLLLIFLFLAIISCLGIGSLFWINKQNSISITSDQVLVSLEKAGYNISNIKPINELNPGPLGYTGKGLCFNLLQDDIYYKVCVVDTDGWKIAKSNAKITNDLNRQMGGYFNHAFFYGPVVINVHPPKDELGNRLDKEVGYGLNVAIGKEIYSVLEDRRIE